jgi:aryl-alcohol dehydrogenase-like predicted oxidoreductase
VNSPVLVNEIGYIDFYSIKSDNMKYNLFGKHTGLKASEIILGAASFGTRSGYGASPDEAMQILKAYADAGGNIIDTSDRYQFGESEELIGRFIKNQRENFIITTKFTRGSVSNPSSANTGNHRKSMIQAVETSLKRLKTEYIDLYMPHFDDGITPLEEIAKGLDDLVKDGKIIYVGLANIPAWKATAIASHTKIHTLQIEYNLLQRTAERELIPMANHFGLATMMYSPLAGGLLTAKYREGEKGRLTQGTNLNVQESDRTRETIDLLVQIAKELEVQPGQIALAWVLSKKAFPIIGARTVTHLRDGLAATNIELTAEHLYKLDQITAVTLGYPHDLLLTVQD